MMASNRPNSSAIGRSRRKKFLFAAILGLFVLISLTAGVFVGIRQLVQGPQLKSLVTARIQNPLTTSVSIDQVNFKWKSLSSGILESQGIRIGQLSTDPVEINIDKLEMSLDFSEIFLGNLDIGFLDIISPRILIDAKKLKSHLTELTSTNSPQVFLNPVIKTLRIKDGSILTQNSSRPNQGFETLLSKIECNAGNIGIDGIERFEFQGLSSDGMTVGRIELTGNLDASENGEHLGNTKSFVKFRLLDYPTFPVFNLLNSIYEDIPSFKGISNAHLQIRGGWDSWKAIGSAEVINLSFFNKKPLKPTVTDRISVSVDAFRRDDLVKVFMSSLSAPGLEASLEANLTKLGSKDTSVNVKVRKADINLEETIKIAPLQLLNRVDRERIIKSGIRGNIKILSASWNYNFSNGDRSRSSWNDLTLDAIFNRVTGFIPGFELPVENASGSLRLDSNEVLFKGINLTIGNSSIVINGLLNKLTSKPQVDLFLTMKAQASDIHTIISSKIWGNKFEPIIKSVQEPHGLVSVTMDLKGELQKPSMKGQIDLDDVQFRTDIVALPVRKVSGKLRFRPDSISTSALRGYVGESSFELKGVVTDKDSHGVLEVKLNTSDLKKLSLLSPGWSITGIAPLSVNMKGRLAEMGFSGVLDLKNLIMLKDGWMKKPSGVRLSLEFSGNRNSDGIMVDDAYLVSDSSRISARAHLKDDGRFLGTINLPPKGIPTSDLTWIADPALELQPGGRIEGDLSIKKDKNQDLSFDANFVLNHISLRLPRAKKRTEGVTGSVQIKGKTLQLSIERSRTGTSLIAADIVITDFAQPKYKAMFDCEFLDTTDFMNESAQAPLMTWIEWIRSNSVIKFLNQSRGTWSLRVGKGKTVYRSFSDFRGDFEGNYGLIKVPKWQMNFAEGIIRGTGLFDIRPNTTRPLKIEFQGDQLNFDRIFVSDPNRVRVDGNVIAQGYMEWRIRSGVENGGLYKTGNMEVRVTDGTIYRFEVLSKIFSLINLGSILRGRLPDVIGQGLPFQKINWTMDIFDNKWKIKNLKFYSDAARIDASGMYFSDQGRIDFKVDVAPLVGFDTILSGLFGNLITRDGKTLNTTFRVRGLTNSPDVRLEPFENLKKEFRQGG